MRCPPRSYGSRSIRRPPPARPLLDSSRDPGGDNSSSTLSGLRGPEPPPCPRIGPAPGGAAPGPTPGSSSGSCQAPVEFGVLLQDVRRGSAEPFIRPVQELLDAPAQEFLGSQAR